MTSLLGGVLLFLCVINAEEHPRVRLIHGPVPYAGVVQVLNDGVWHFVCGDLWDFPTANVTCNQLGFQDGALLSLKGFPFGSEVELRNSSKFIVVQCQGLESSLVACPFQEVNTNTCAKGFANVICRNESIDLNDTSVRLTGANVMYAGRVEVRYAGIWGRACSRNWGANETNVVCRQLGYRGAFKGVVTTQRIFGKGEGPAWLQIDCQGDEKSLEDCSKGEWGLEDCSEDINARTSTNAICMVTESSNETVEVRLLGTTSSAGQVQVRYNGLWGAVNFSGWDFKDARVVCRQLGFIGLAAVFEGAPHSPRQGLVWLTDLNCTGEESSISDCPHPGWGSRAAHASESTTGVQCYTNESAGDFTFRLKGSESSNAGRVEVFVKGDWGKVCDNSWDLKDAGVLCRQLGFSAAVTTLSGSTFGEGTGTGIMDYIRCSGDEDSLAHCPHRRTHSCGIRSVAGVVCSPTDNSTKELNVRLGTTMQGPPNAGRVEVRFAGVWGTVCRSGFEKVDADVVCRQLGFPAAQEVAPVSWSFGHGGGPIWVSHLRCTGNETSIEQCPRGVEWGIVTNCSHSDDVGVICQLPQPNRTQIADDFYVPITIEMNIAQWNLTAFKLAVAKAFTEHCGVASCFAEQSAQSKALEFKSSDVRIPSGFPKVLPGGAHILVNVSVVKPDGEPGRPIPAEHLEQLLLETSRVISKKLGYNIIQVNKTPVTNNNVMTTQKTDSVGGVRRSEMPPTRPKWIIAMAIFLPIVIIIGVAVILHFACDENWKDKETSISEDDNDVRQPLQEIEHKKSNERNGNDSPSPVI